MKSLRVVLLDNRKQESVNKWHQIAIIIPRELAIVTPASVCQKRRNRPFNERPSKLKSLHFVSTADFAEPWRQSRSDRPSDCRTNPMFCCKVPESQ